MSARGHGLGDWLRHSVRRHLLYGSLCNGNAIV
jgi:hypothetical protein